MAITGNIPAPSIFQAAEYEIKREIHGAFVEKITAQFVKELEEKIGEVVRREVEKYTIGKLVGVKDMMRLRDELHAYIHFTGDEEPTEEII